MSGHCPACGKLVTIVPAPPDVFGRPRKRVIDHEPAGAPVRVLCSGSRSLI